MSKINEGQIDSNGKFSFNGWFRKAAITAILGLCSVVGIMGTWGFTQVNNRIDEAKTKNDQQDERLAKLEVIAAKVDVNMDSIARDINEIKQSLPRPKLQPTYKSSL